MSVTFPLNILAAEQSEIAAERLMNDVLGAMNIFAVYIGDRLGYYRELACCTGLTPAALAQRTGTQERYVREWLEQQAAACMVEVVAGKNGGGENCYSLSPGYAEVLTDRDSLNYMAPMAQLMAGAVQPLDALLQAYRTGGGVPYSDFGANFREGQASANRAMFLQQLGSEWLPAMPDVHARLQADPPARVADLGCGAGWSSIGIASSYPKVHVDGYDLDSASVELAQHNVASAGLQERVHIRLQDASDPALMGSYDLVLAIECLHDMSNPVGALGRMRLLAGENGAVLVVDEHSLESFMPCAESVEQLFYGFSVLHCLPASMAEQPSAATGTVMRPETMRRYALEAGFRRVDILPIDHALFRFYRLS